MRSARVFRRFFGSLVTVALSLLSALALPSPGSLRPAELRCEFLLNPLGIDNPRPRLSWIVESRRRGDRQSAYRILVASSAGNLAAGKGDLWDSGRMSNGQTSSLQYAGRPLVSHGVCYWKVMAWDRDGRPGPWSEPARWSVGILDPTQWHADWIGYDAPRGNAAPAAFATARWIWFAPDKPGEVPAGKRYFVRTLAIAPGLKVVRADLAVTADDRYRLWLDGVEVASSASGPDAWRTPQRLDVASRISPGKNVIFVEAENLSGGHAGFIGWIRLLFEGGKEEVLVTDRTWLSSDTLFPEWKNNGPGPGEGKESRVIGNIGTLPWRLLDGSMLTLPPPRYLSRSFTVRRPLRRAVLYASALGLCDLYLNDARVSDDYFTPGWTDYSRRVYYRTYDVTRLVRTGDNTLGGILADGWYSGYLGWAVVRDHYGTKTRLKALLRLEYADGTAEEVGSGSGWRAWTGPILEADFLMGETYDARLQEEGRFGPHRGGAPVDVGAEMSPILQSHPAQPVRKFATMRPVSVKEPTRGVYVFDLGQNFAGVARLKVNGAAGQRVTLRFAERLNPDGTIYTDNLRGARVTDTYICGGSGDETWEPRFTFHGFQYVEVTGLSVPPPRDAVTGIALSTDTPLTGEFHCSSPMLNRLQKNILWTQRANYIDVPTDCPQRDERLGWTGDAQVYVRTAALNTDVQAFFHKWLVDMRDAQRSDGQFPMVAPLKVAGADGGPGWADAGVICPWAIHEVYGDTSILAGNYDAMKRFVDFCRDRSTVDLLPPKEFHCFGDWLNIQAETPKEVLFTAFFARVADLLSKSAGILGKSGDAGRYGALYDSVCASFRRAYVHPDGTILGDTQTGYALALSFGLLNSEQAGRAAQHLIADIERRGYHLSTGFIGTRELMFTLTRIGRNDLAYRLLMNETFPSWGFTIRHGATSVWERWDGWTPERGFQDPGMNSFAHYSFGAVYQWMVENIGGIRSDGAGYRTIVVAPDPGGQLTSARVVYRSVNGEIRSDWVLEKGKFTITVSVPANTEATVALPGVGGPVTESGKPVASQSDVHSLGHSPEGRELFRVGGGEYRFAYTCGR